MGIKLLINGLQISAAPGEYLLNVARRNGFSIPSLCSHEAVEPIGACRVCLVELTANGPTTVTTSCNLLVEEGFRILTDSPAIRKHRAMNLELLLARAPASETLRRLATEYGVIQSRFMTRSADTCRVTPSGGAPGDAERQRAPTGGDARRRAAWLQDPARIHESELQNCILCELCTRVCAKLGHNALSVIGRGDTKRIGLPFNQPAATCIGCGSCYSVCPTRCIMMHDTKTHRSIWGKNFKYILCKICHSPVITEEHHQYAMIHSGLPEDYYDVCESCKQAANAERFNALVW